MTTLKQAAIVLTGIGIAATAAGFVGRRWAGATNRVHCELNLRQIGTSIGMYAGENDGAMPADLASLTASGDLTNGVFVCPATNLAWSAATQPAAIRADFAAGGHCSYVYVDGYATDSALSPADVVAFEPLANHGDGANALFGDGHVEFLSKAAATTIEQQFKNGTRPVRVPAGM